MKTNLRLACLLVATLLLPAAPLSAKGKPKHKAPAPTSPQPTPSPAVLSPSEALAPYITNLDHLLDLSRPAGKNAQTQLAFLEQAPGQIITLHQQFSAAKAKSPASEQGKYDAAIATCNALSSALDERQKVLGDLQTSQAVKGSGKLEQGPRKDNLEQGLHGGNTAKAVGAIVELKREKGANKKAARSAAGGDDALTAMSINRWNQRTIELRTKINAAYARIK